MAAFESLVRFLHARWQRPRRGSALDIRARSDFIGHVLPLLLAGAASG